MAGGADEHRFGHIKGEDALAGPDAVLRLWREIVMYPHVISSVQVAGLACDIHDYPQESGRL